MPREGVLVLDDLVRGRVEFPWASEQDHVIQRADGTCLYHLASVVDDQAMKISHVVRAEEHLSNTPRQIFIFEKLGYALPKFAHLPYVAEPGSKNKLSKRKLNKYLTNPDFRAVYDHAVEVAAKLDQDLHSFVENRGLPDADDADRQRLAIAFRNKLPIRIGPFSDDPREQARLEDEIRNRTLDFFEDAATIELYRRGTDLLNLLGLKRNPETFNPVIIDFYEQVGYLPHAILNYLLLLGWSLDGTSEEFSMQEMIDLFSLDRVTKAPASFDAKKLLAFQARAMQQLSLNERTSLVAALLERAGWDVESNAIDLRRIVELAADRIRVAGDIVEFAWYFTTDTGFPYDAAAFEKRIVKPAGAIELLTKFRGALAVVEPFTAERLETWMHEWTAAEGIKLGDVVHAVRVAVTGKAVGFGLFDTLAILGRERCQVRIDRALALARPHP